MEIEQIVLPILVPIMLDRCFYIKIDCFQNLSTFEGFGKIFPKLGFALNLIYTYNRGEHYDSARLRDFAQEAINLINNYINTQDKKIFN